MTTTTTAIIVSTGVIVSISFFTNAGSLHSIWSILGQFQLIILLPLTNAYLHEEVVNYCSGMDFALVSMKFVPGSSVGEYTFLPSLFSRDQDNSYLEEIGLESQSGLVNILPSLVFLLEATIIYAMLEILVRTILYKYNNWITKLVEKVIESMKLSFYIRFFLESYEFMLLSSTSELRKTDMSSAETTVSFLISLVIFVGLIVMLTLLFLIIYSQDIIRNGLERKYYGVIFEGIKTTSKAKWYEFWRTVRKIVLVSFLFFASSLNTKAVIALCTIMQLAYF